MVAMPEGRLPDLRPFCQGCYFDLWNGGRPRWYAAFEAACCGCEWRGVSFTNDRGVGHCDLHWWVFDNVAEWGRAVRKTKPWVAAKEGFSLGIVVRGYNRLGRCVLWSP